jgi:hypothetical protein
MSVNAYDHGAHTPIADKLVISSKPSGTGGFVDTQNHNHVRDVSPLMRTVNLDHSQNSFHTRPETPASILTTSRHAVLYPQQSDRELGQHSGIVTTPFLAQTLTSGMIMQDKARLRSSSSNVLAGGRHQASDLDSKV